MIFFVPLIAYLLGSIPFGLLLAKWMGAGDLRAIGSGNIGATNALRTGNKKLAALTLLLDMLKGTVSVLIAQYFAPDVASLAGLVAVIGHIFPVWLRFKGGKGVATGLGVVLALEPFVFLATIAVWLGVFKYSRVSSIAALAAFAVMPIFSALENRPVETLILLIVSIIIFITHRENINRLVKGEESVFTGKKHD